MATAAYTRAKMFRKIRTSAVYSYRDWIVETMGAEAANATELKHEGHTVTLQERVARAYEESREDIYRYIVMLGLPREEAQEICQEAFLRLYTALSSGQQIENLRAWAFTVARNQALTTRATSASFAALDQVIEDRLAGESPTPEQSLLNLEKLRRVQKAVRRLSDQQRQCLHLRTKGFRYREIAEIVGVSTSTVGEAVQSAVKRLRRALYE